MNAKNKPHMNLILRNCYPYPYPQDATEAEQEAISDEAGAGELVLADVIHFEWLHTVTVEFATFDAWAAAQQATGWKSWDTPLTLEAPTSGPEGYEHPAIIAAGKAWCGFGLAV